MATLSRLVLFLEKFSLNNFIVIGWLSYDFYQYLLIFKKNVLKAYFALGFNDKSAF